MKFIDMSTLLIIVAALMVVTNIIVQVLKKVTWDKIPTNLLVVVIAELLTLAAGAAYAQICAITILWFHVVAAIIVGIFVAYAAMFGFDKLREALEWSGKLDIKN